MVLGVGASIAGFSLSLPLAGASGFSVMSASFQWGDQARAAEQEGQIPQYDDLGLVDGERVVLRRGETGGVADGAVDVDDVAARPADQVVVVVPDPGLVANHRARGWMRRTSPASVSTRKTSYTAWWETVGRSILAARIRDSVSA